MNKVCAYYEVEVRWQICSKYQKTLYRIYWYRSNCKSTFINFRVFL